MIHSVTFPLSNCSRLYIRRLKLSFAISFENINSIHSGLVCCDVPCFLYIKEEAACFMQCVHSSTTYVQMRFEHGAAKHDRPTERACYNATTQHFAEGIYSTIDFTFYRQA